MKKVFINGNREAYKPEQCGNTLTVKELIDILEGCDEDALVYINEDNYTYGSIKDFDVYEEEVEEDD